MNLEDQVCSLELSKRLKELGVKQESYFWYGKLEDPTFNDIKENCIFTQAHWQWNETCYYYSEYSAFTVAELGESLPNCILRPDLAPFDNYRLIIRKFISVDEYMNCKNNFIVNYECDSTESSGVNAWMTRKLNNNIFDPNLANAMAKMLVYLIENNLLKERVK